MCTETSINGVSKSQTELHMNSNHLEEEVNNIDPINLEIANGQTFLTDEHNEILIGDSTVEVGNSHDYEV